MSLLTRRLLRTATSVRRTRTQKRIIAVSTRIQALETRREAEGGALDRYMTLDGLEPLFKLWTQANKQAPKVVPEPPGFWAKLLFSTSGVPTGSIGKVLLTFVGQITKVKPALIRVMMAKNIQGGMTDQAAAMQQSEKQWDQLVAPLREYANYDGVPENVKNMIQQAVGAAG